MKEKKEMAGYVIHLAVAKEYLRNFRIKDEKENKLEVSGIG